jgi:hypothetical protein
LTCAPREELDAGGSGATVGGVWTNRTVKAENG